MSSHGLLCPPAAAWLLTRPPWTMTLSSGSGALNLQPCVLRSLRPPRHLSLCVSFPRTLTCPTRCPLEPLPSLRSISTRDTTSLHTSSEPLPSDHAPEALPAPAVALTNAPASFHPGDSQRMTFLTSVKSSTYTNNLGFLAKAAVPTATPRSPPWSHSHCAPDSPTALSAMTAWPVHHKGPAPVHLEGPHPPGGPGAHPCL